ncbi:MAG: lamin tail domain-containing protein [Pirellulales bacterium]
MRLPAMFRRLRRDCGTRLARRRFDPRFEALESRHVLDSVAVFNEINYNPAGDNQALEWIELRNMLSVDLDLTGWTLRDGVAYAFPAGTIIPADGYLVVAADPMALQNVTGFADALGPYLGNLSNGGEEIELFNNSDRQMDVVDYGDNAPWPVGPDGSGATLAKFDENWDASDPANWRTSLQLGGTPGAENFPRPDLTPQTSQPIALTSNWRYEDSGVDLGTAWRNPSFVDAGWSQGQAVFRAGSDPVTPALGLRFLPFANDADSGISAQKTYTHKVDFGIADTGALVNGVQFSQATPATLGSVPNFSLTPVSGALTTSCTNSAAANVTGNVLQLMQDSMCNVLGAATGAVTITLSGLTVGAHYDTRLYSRQPAASGARVINVQFDTNADGTPESTSAIDQNNAAANPPGLAAANQAYAISYDFVATNSSMRIRLAQTQSNTSWVLYGLTNEVIGGSAVTAEPIDTLFSTGLGDDGQPLSAGANDPHWYHTDSAQPVLAMTGHPAWAGNTPQSQWVGVTSNGGTNVPNGPYSFSTQFDLSGYDASTLGFSMLIGVDDGLDSVRLNGNLTGISTSGFAALNGPFTIPAASFLPGVNTLTFNFTNGGTAENPSGLRVQFDATAVPLVDHSQVELGPNTHYFRQEFQFAGDPQDEHELELNALIDDGAVFYLNGQEIYRHNMPAGTIAYATAAATDISGAQQTGRISVPAGALAIGRNVLAVEVHQFSAASNDVRFGAELFITETPVPPDALPHVVINELPGSLDPNFFVELKNEDTVPRDLGGWIVKRQSMIPAQYVLPSTVLNPGELLLVDEATLGFEAADGDRIFLIRAGGESIIDAHAMTTRLRGRSSPHGGRWLWPSAATPGASNTFDFRDEVVINEIMYHHFPTYEVPATASTYSTTSLVPISATWRYNDRGQNLGTSWHQSAHAVDGVNWQSGQGLIGYDVDAQPEPIRTTLANPVSNNPFVVTYYFETDFTFNGDPSDPTLELILRHIVDDAAVFYLNGVEVSRYNLPGGTITSSTLSSTTLTNASDVGNIVLPKDQLQVGANRLSVEVHQASLTSSDIVFGAELVTRTLLAPPLPGQPYQEVPEEWIELYNRSSSDVVLTGWKLRGGIDYNFAPGTTIPAGQYLVVAKDRVSLAAKYPGIVIVGDFSGSLSNHDDVVRLEAPDDNPADEVHYFEGNGEWPSLADGNGSTLELRDPDADNAQAGAWAASTPADGQWQTITYRGVAQNPPGSNDPTNWYEFALGLLDSGEVLIDDVSVLEDPSGTRIQRVLNGDFSNGVSNWRLLGNHGLHGLSAVIPEPGNPANNVLKVVATGTTEHMGNHVVTTFAGSAPIVNGREYEISLRAKWLGGSPQLHTRLYFNRLAKTTILPTPTTAGTPGQANSQRVANIGPTYSGFQHAPAVPQAGQPIAVSAEPNDPDGIASLVVQYSVGGAPFVSASMVPDADGVWRAQIPGQAASAIVQFYVEGTDTLGAMSTYPAAGPESRALFKVNDNVATTGLRHNFRVVMLAADSAFMHQEVNAQSNHRLGATIIYGEQQVYYDVGIRVKGSGYSRGGAATGYNFRFDPERPLFGVHEITSIDRNGGPYGLGASHRELTIKHIANRAGGVPMSYDDILNFIGPSPAYNSSAQLLGSRFEDEFLDTQFDNGGDGTRFKLELIYYNTTTGSPAQIHPRPNTVNAVDIQYMGEDENSYRWNYLIRNNRGQDDFAQIIELGRTLSMSGSNVGGPLDVASQAVMDVDEWLRVFAWESLAGVNDTYNQGLSHNLQIYVRPEDGRVLAFPWDNDFALNQSTSLNIYGSGSNFRKVIDIPTNQRLFQGHLLDIINTTYNTAYLTPWVNQYGTLSAVNDTASILQYIDSRRSYVLSQLLPSVPFAITTNGGADFTVATENVTLEGNGWINVREIRLNDNASPLAVTWLDQDSWRVTLPLAAGANSLTLRAFDHQGQAVGSDTIAVTTSFVAPTPIKHLRITELMYHPADPSPAEFAAGFTDADDFEFVELTNLADAPLSLSTARFVNGVQFGFAGSAIDTIAAGGYVLVVSNPAAFAFRYGNDLPVAGEYTGNLNNGGEAVRLETTAGQTILDFNYDDATPPWHPSTDGLGYSLVKIDPAAATATYGDGAAWRPSFELSGSPGARDAMFGDFDFDNRVGLADLAYLQSRLGTAVGATASTGDLDGDGDVDRADAARLSTRFGRAYIPPPPPAPAASLLRATAETLETPRVTARPTRRVRPDVPRQPSADSPTESQLRAARTARLAPATVDAAQSITIAWSVARRRR